MALPKLSKSGAAILGFLVGALVLPTAVAAATQLVTITSGGKTAGVSPAHQLLTAEAVPSSYVHFQVAASTSCLTGYTVPTGKALIVRALSGESVVEADIRAGSISLGGRVKGNLVSPGDVSLPSKSRVEGDVQARSVTVHGAVKGNIAAQDRVELGPGARVVGDIDSRRLVIAEGAVFRGRSIMGESRPEGSR